MELVGRARRGGINDPLAVDGNMRSCTVERLLGEDACRLENAIRFGRHTPEIARAQRDIAVAHEDNLLAVSRPGGLRVAVPDADIQALPRIAMIAGQRDRLAVPVPVANPTHVDVERAGR